MNVINQQTGLRIGGAGQKIRLGLAAIFMLVLASVGSISQSTSNIAHSISISCLLTKQGSIYGGEQVIIKGDGFLKTIAMDNADNETSTPTISKISFGTVTTTDFQVLDNNTISVNTPVNLNTGKVDVILHPIDNTQESITLPLSYEYQVQ